MKGWDAARCPGLEAQHALSQLAARMNRDGTRDLRWWNIPRWATAWPRILVAVLALVAVGPLGGFAGSGYDFQSTFGSGVDSGLTSGFVFGLVFWFSVTRRHRLPRRIRLRRWHQALRRDALGRGLVPGLMVGIGTGFAASVVGSQVRTGVAAGAAAGLATALVFMISGPGADDTSSVVPASSWRNDLAFGLVVGLVLGIVSGLATASTAATSAPVI